MSYKIAIEICDAEIKRLEFNEATKDDFGDEYYAADDVPNYELCRQFSRVFQDPYIVREMLVLLDLSRDEDADVWAWHKRYDALMAKIGGE